MADTTNDTRPVDREYLNARLGTITEQISHLATREDLAQLEVRVGRQILLLFVATTTALCAAIVGAAFIVQ